MSLQLLGSRESDPSSTVEGVSTITGDYSEVEIDLTVPAPDPLMLPRYYNSGDAFDIAQFGGWRFHPHCYLSIQKDPKEKGYVAEDKRFERTLAYTGNPEGSILTYVGWYCSSSSEKVLLKIDVEEECAGICNTAKGSISSWTNHKNNELFFDPSTDSFELHLCTKGKRFYQKSPFQDLYLLSHEILPSGNKLFYEFDDKGRLTSIKETNSAEEKTLAWIRLQHGDNIHVETSDGQVAKYYFEPTSSDTRILTRVERSYKPSIEYEYKLIDNRALLTKKSLPEGRSIQIDYNCKKSNLCKVQSVAIPLNESEFSKWIFSYGDLYTQVEGPGDRRSIYRFDDDFRLTAIEQFLEGSLYRVYKKNWGNGKDTGNFLSTSMEDANGDIYHYKHFIYDLKGNILEEREYGDISGKGHVPLIISKEGHETNQCGLIKKYSYFSGENTEGYFQTDSGGSGVKYWYKKGTNLLLKKFHLTEGIADQEDGDTGIFKRHIYEYNEDATLIKVMVDDGGVDGYWHGKFIPVPTEGRITVISPKQDLPNLGAPEIIEEKYLELSGRLSSDRLKNKKEILHKKTINQFDSYGNIISQEIYDGNTEYQYILKKEYADGFLVSESDPLGNQTLYTYDENQNLTLESHESTGISIEYTYDLQNHLIGTTRHSKARPSYETHASYDPAGNVIRETDQFGGETTYIYDSLGRPTEVFYPKLRDKGGSLVNPKYSFCYDLFDHPVSVVNAKGEFVSKTYNVQGKPTGITHADGSKEVFEYDNGGNLRKYCNRSGLFIEYSYDRLGRIVEEKHLKRGTVYPNKKLIYEYGTFHKASEKDGNGNKTSYTYDGLGRIAEISKGKQKLEFLYDSIGRASGVKKWKTKSSYSLSVKEYDLLDRITEERIEDETGKTLFKKKYLYNETGLLEKVIGYPQNQKSILFIYEYDDFSRLIKTENAAHQITTIVYNDFFIDEWGQRAQKRLITDPLGNQKEEIYDAEGHLIKATLKDRFGTLLSQLESHFDVMGNRVQQSAQIIENGKQSRSYTIEWSLKEGDRLDSSIQGKGSDSELTARYAYNHFGEVVAKYISDSDTPIQYQYDNCGRLQSLSHKKDLKYTFKYNRNDNIKEISFAPSSKIKYSFDENDLLLSEEFQDEYGNYQLSRIYDGEGKIQTLKFPDGSYVEYIYEGPFVKSAKRFSKEKKELYTYKVAERDLMGNILEEILPGYIGSRKQIWDLASRRTAITTDFFEDRIPENGIDPLDNIKKRKIILEDEEYEIDYDYNALCQLISEKGEIDYSYAYDSVGNRLQKDGLAYTINDSNQLLNTKDATYTFHPNGTRATKTIGEKTWTYQSNALGQITSIQDSNQSIISFTYAPNGKCLTKCIEAKGCKKKVLRFFYLGDTEIGCVDEKGTIIELKMPSDPNNPEAPSIAIEIGKETYVPLYDLQGNVACLLDPERRKAIESYRYSAYGEEEIINRRGRATADSSVGNPWRYQGKRIDQELGLIYFGYRFYDPEIGRWISPDPSGPVDGPNLYTYARNNPIKYVDYFGLSSETKQSCQCGYCVREEGWCHCKGEDLTHTINSCACRSLACVHKQASHLSPKSDVKSAVSGITHGVVDFVVGSLHDLQTAAVHMGSGDIEMTFDERMQMLEAVEISQASRMTAAEGWMMDALSIDQSDALYHSCRSKTTLGLEVGSLVVGGYGAVKGVIGFTRLARMPVQVAKMSEILSSSATLNRFHLAARNLSKTGQNNIRVLRGWAKNKGWHKLPNPQGRPEIWGVNISGRFEFRLKIKAEASLRSGLAPRSGVPRFDARLGEGNYINPFTNEVGSSKIGTHIPLEYQFYE